MRTDVKTRVGSLVVAGLLWIAPIPAQIPFHQDKPPNDPYTPVQALARMRVPAGFSVELVASEPDIVNPIAMAFDEKGRIWITESVEYPRKSEGKGRDRIKVLEDTDRDGKVDKVTVFADGLNIPSGIAVGHGGVWVANAPNLYFMRDTDGDLVADKTEVVATGFGRDDTHELPNSLTWGPDGYLYGLNGVFNHCEVTQDLDQDGKIDDGKVWRFTCAMFRVHPKTRKFSVFCEGTSNPWGIAFDGDGSAFVSACVIDHLWHLIETGYYERQGGAYPPHTWRLGSIVEHKHQKAAYCGLTWFDSAAYPPEYRGRMFMGNIHGNCLNSDELERRGSSYFATARPDFLSADDAWFMPVAQKTGPDGCLYVLDWYDRYHCYQDANRDPKGIDRLKGRLYRIRHLGAARAPAFDLAQETDDQLIERLADPNVYFRRVAQRLLSERDRDPDRAGDASRATRAKLETLAADMKAPRRARLHALWAMVSTGRLSHTFHHSLLQDKEPTFRAWGVRAAGNFGRVDETIRSHILTMAADRAPDVRLQVAIAARKIAEIDPVPLLVDVLVNSDDDKVIPHIVWQNLHPLLAEHGAQFLALVRAQNQRRCEALRNLLPRVTERLLTDAQDGGSSAATLFGFFELILDTDANARVAQRCLTTLARMIQTGELAKPDADALRAKLIRRLERILDGRKSVPIYTDAAMLAASWRNRQGLRAVRRVLADRRRSDAVRLRAIDVLISVADAGVLPAARRILEESDATAALHSGVINSLGRLDDDAVADVVVSVFHGLDAVVRPQAIDLLTQRVAWSRRLIRAAEKKSIPAGEVNGNQIRYLSSQFTRDGETDPSVAKRIRKLWGAVRPTRSANREKEIARVRSLIRVNRGDPIAGQKVFARTCAQCHTIHGEGSDIGPDLTNNGRGSFEQLLSNALDPHLVVGEAYQLRTVVTKRGRSVGGMLVEDSPRRVVIKTLGGKAETIARPDVKEILESPLSFMPEGLESTMMEQELIDLFALLIRDKPPGAGESAFIPGYEYTKPRDTKDRAEFDSILAAVAPGFHVEASGKQGVALLKDHFGRPGVVRTHPVGRRKPCILTGTVTLPSHRKSALELSASHHGPATSDHDWRLLVKVDGKALHDSIVGKKAAANGWVDVTIDLSEYAGRRVKIELHNHPNHRQPNDGNSEFGYWARVALVAAEK